MASPTPPPKEPRPNPESLGRSALRNGFITPGQLSECLQLLEAARRQGRPVRLGQILVERGYLTPTQIQDLLAGQQKVLMRCSGCGRQFNVVRPEPGLSFRCPPCGGVLMSPRILGEVSADGSWFTEPGPPERVAEEVLEEETPRPATPPRQPRYRPYAPPPLPPAPRGSRLRTAGMVCGSAILLIVAVGFPLGLFDEPGPRTAGVRSPSAPGESETGTGPAAPLARRAPTEGEPSQARRAPGEGEGPKSRRTPGEGDARPASGAPEAKPPVPSAPDPFLAALESARKVIVAGDLPAARSAVAALERDPAARDPQHAAEMDRLRGDLRRRVRALFDRLAAEIDTLCREGKFDEAESLCDKAHELTDSETSRTLPSLVDRVRAGREKAALASLRPAVPPAEELAAWKSDGEARVRAAREQIAAARTEERDRIAQQKARLLEATKRDPIDIQWSDKLALKRCLVSDFSRDKVRLVSQSPPVEMEGPWEGLPNESVYEIRKTALDPKDARGWFDLGRFLALKRMGRQAVQAFDQAFATDASLRAVAPDMAKVLSPPTLFNATNYRVAGGFVHLLYDFGRAEEAQDFQGQGAEAEVKDGRLELRGRGFVACTIRDIPFTGKVSYALDPGPAVSSWVSFGMIQTSAGGNRRLYRVLYYPEEASWFFMEVGEDVETPRAIRWTGTNSRKPRFVLGLDGSEFTLSIDGEVVHRSRIPKIDEVMLFAGGVAVGEGVDPDSGRRVIAPMSNRPAAVACERIEVTGAVPPSWLSKVRSSEAAMFERELEDGLKVKPGETASHLPHPFREPAWSVYPPAWRDAYEKAHRAMDTFVRYEGAADYVTAANALAAALATAPRHPGVWYLAGQLALWSGEEEAASESCRRALDFDPYLLEARVALAERLTSDGEFGPARSEIEKVLAVRPDFAPALVAGGRVALYERKYEAALDLLGAARALDPANPQIPVALRAAGRVRDGPSWKNSHEAKARRHRIITDISEAAAKHYAKLLDAIWGEYVRVGGVDPAASRPVDVLVFNDDERFHTYSELTLDDRMESVLGYFHPLYWQIHIFEDAKVEETYRVLYHEGFHYYGRLVFRTLPIWLNEGLAEYVGGTLIEKGVVKQRGLVHHGRLNDLVDAMGAGWEPVPFEKLAVMSRPEFYAEDAPFKYAQAWSVVHFLMEGGDAGLKSAFTKYIGLLREGKRAEEAYAQSFADAAAPSQWESRWRAYVKAMKEKRDDPAPRRR